MSSTTVTTNTALINTTFKDTLNAMFDNCSDEQKDMLSKLLTDQDTFIVGQCKNLSVRLETNGKPLKEFKVRESIGKVIIGTDNTLYTVVERENKKAKDGKSLHFVSCDENGVAKESTPKGHGHLKPEESEPFYETNDDGEYILRTNVSGKEDTLWNASTKVTQLGHGKVHTADIWVEVKEKKVGKSKKIVTTPTEDAKELDIGTLSKGSCLNKDNKVEYYVVSPVTIAKDVFQNRWQKISETQWNTEDGQVIKKGEKKWLVAKNDEGDKCWELQ